MRNRNKLMSLAAAVLGLLMIPAAAFAYTPSGSDFITCVAGGDSNVECTAGVFDADSEVEFEAEVLGVVFEQGTATANADGEVAFDFDVPEDSDEGDITVTLRGTLDGEAQVLSDVIARVEADGEVIANAGSDAGLLAAGALGALAVGGAALFASRRKRTTV